MVFSRGARGTRVIAGGLPLGLRVSIFAGLVAISFFFRWSDPAAELIKAVGATPRSDNNVRRFIFMRPPLSVFCTVYPRLQNCESSHPFVDRYAPAKTQIASLKKSVRLSAVHHYVDVVGFGPAGNHGLIRQFVPSCPRLLASQRAWIVERVRVCGVLVVF